MTAPICRNCGKPIPKRTTTVSAPGNNPAQIRGWRYTGNQQVVSRRYTSIPAVGNHQMSLADDAPGASVRQLHHVTVWDGESYQPVFQYFCKTYCAAMFGLKAARLNVLKGCTS